MKCIYCGTVLTAKDYCPGCGQDVTLQKRIVRISNLLYNRGLEKAQVRDLSGAVSCLNRSLKFNKENIDARNLLGLCYFETGEVVSALVEWVISKNLKPQDNLANDYLQVLQNNRNRLDQINSTIHKYNQSIDYCRQGHEDMALMQLRKVISRNPKLVKAYQLLALLYMHRQEWEKARRLLKKASAIDNTNTTTLRFLTEIEEETGRTSLFGRSRRKKEESESAKEKALRYVSGNQTIIAPTTFRDSSTIATFINIMLGILLGAAIVWFLTVPAVRQNANDRANRSVTDANTSLATITATVQDLQDQVDSAHEETAKAKQEKEDANSRVEGYKGLLQVADLYVKGDQTKTVEALGKLNESDYDGEGKQLFDDLTLMVGDALFSQYYNAGTTAYVAGNYKEAASQLQKAVDSDPTGSNSMYYDALYYLGFAYFNAGDSGKADDTFNAFIQRYPDSASVVQGYIGAKTTQGSGASAGTSSQGEASMNQGASSSAEVAWTDPTTGQHYDAYGNPINDGSGSSSPSSSSQVAWTDPATGQHYDAYGNPINDGSGSSGSSAQIAWTDPTTGQGYDMYGNPVYQ